MSDLSGFNANDVPPPSFAAIPPDMYACMATASERKLTRAGDGEYLQFTVDVLDEKYNTKKLWMRLNLWNKNPAAVSIAQQELGAFCRAVGVITPKDSSELLNIPFIAKLGIETDKGGKEQNTIDGWYSIAEATAMQAPTAAAAPAPAAAGAGAKQAPVWPPK